MLGVLYSGNFPKVERINIGPNFCRIQVFGSRYDVKVRHNNVEDGRKEHSRRSQ